MTTKADFTEEEWKQVLEGPTSAGMIVTTAEKGGTFRETFAMAGAYTDARKEHGASELLDEIVTHRPKTERIKAHSKEELKDAYLEEIRTAVGARRGQGDPGGARRLPTLRRQPGEEGRPREEGEGLRGRRHRGRGRGDRRDRRSARHRLRRRRRGPTDGRRAQGPRQEGLRQGAEAPADRAGPPAGMDRPRGPEGRRPLRGPRHRGQGRHDPPDHRKDSTRG